MYHGAVGILYVEGAFLSIRMFCTVEIFRADGIFRANWAYFIIVQLLVYFYSRIVFDVLMTRSMPLGCSVLLRRSVILRIACVNWTICIVCTYFIVL